MCNCGSILIGTLDCHRILIIISHSTLRVPLDIRHECAS